MNLLFHQYIIKMKVVIIVSAIKYTIYFTFEYSIFLCYRHRCSKDTTTKEVRGEHQNAVFKRGCLLQFGMQTYFHEYSVSLSLSHNKDVTSQSSLWPSRECGIFSANILISLLVTYYWFSCTTSCLSLIWRLLPKHS